MDTRDDSRNLTARLERLERQNRKLRLAVLTALITIASAGLVGFSAIQEQLLWARQFVLVDANETKRAELVIGQDGAPMLKFYDTDGKSRAEIGVSETGLGFARFLDAQGTSRIAVEQTGSGGLIGLNDGDGTRIAGFGTNSAGNPVMHFNDGETGNLRYAVYIGDNGPYLGLYGAQGQPVHVMETLSDGSPMMTQYDKNGEIRSLMGFASEWSNPVINLRNPEGTATVMVETGGVFLRDGQGQTRTSLAGGDSPGLTVRSADGSVIWESGAAPTGGPDRNR